MSVWHVCPESQTSSAKCREMFVLTYSSSAPGWACWHISTISVLGSNGRSLGPASATHRRASLSYMRPCLRTKTPFTSSNVAFFTSWWCSGQQGQFSDWNSGGLRREWGMGHMMPWPYPHLSRQTWIEPGLRDCMFHFLIPFRMHKTLESPQIA